MSMFNVLSFGRSEKSETTENLTWGGERNVERDPLLLKKGIKNRKSSWVVQTIQTTAQRVHETLG